MGIYILSVDGHYFFDFFFFVILFIKERPIPMPAPIARSLTKPPEPFGVDVI